MRSLSLFSLAALVFCLGLLSSTVVEGAPGEFARIRSLARFFEVVLDKDHDGFMSQKEVRERTKHTRTCTTGVSHQMHTAAFDWTTR